MVKWMACVCCVWLLVGCTKIDNPVNADTKAIDDHSLYWGKKIVLVNDQPVYESELDLTLEKIVKAPITIDDRLRRTVIESIVASKAMSQASQNTLGIETLADIELRVKAYREELLMKHYLANHTQPQPVTLDMVKQYYQKNSDQFTEEAVKTFEYVMYYPVAPIWIAHYF